jgi:hypothetical protein
MRNSAPIVLTILIVTGVVGVTVRNLSKDVPVGERAPADPPRAKPVVRVGDHPWPAETSVLAENASSPQSASTRNIEDSIAAGNSTPSVGGVVEHEVTRDVAGKPLSISVPIDRACGKLPLFCKEGLEILTAVANEPRDDSWATATETIIRKEIERPEHGQQTIRALECRSTLCALEVVTLTEAVKYDYKLRFELLHTDTSFLFWREADKSGVPVWVSVRFFHRT